MRLPEQFRSSSFRIAVAYSALFFVSTMAILGLTYLAATADALGTVRASLTDDMATMRKVYQTEGRDELVKEVARRAREAPDDRFFLLIDEADTSVAGNLPPAAFRPGWSNHRLDDALVQADPSLRTIAGFNSDNELRLLGIGETLGDGLRLMAARDAHALDETQEIIVAGLLWGGIVTSFLALAGGYILSLGPTRRVDAIAESLRTILTGRFDVRLPRTGKRDEIDRMSADINAMLDRIEVLVASLKQVSTDIAHDLRTPLSRLRQKLERMRRQARTVGEYEAVMDQAIGETDTIIETFNALLRIAQIEAGARKEKFADVDLSTLLVELFELFGSVAEDRGHRMTASIAENLNAFGDRDLLTQLFSNLIENAITHVPAPGRIELAAGRAGDGDVTVAVLDDGPGVPEAERRRIFRRLYRLDASRTTPGSGLGLAMAEAIAELHNATIEALDNNPGLRMQVRFRPATADADLARRKPALAAS
jgi:signal transduction histidine kinase